MFFDTLTAPIAHATRITLHALSRPLRADQADSNPRKPRGIALLIALVTIALLSSVVVEFAYSSRVNVAMASNERDQLKSYFLARSAVNITILLLAFQQALQRESQGTENDMGQLIGRAMRRSNFQIYQYVDLLMKPFHSGRLETPVGGVDLVSSGVEGFGNFSGEFTAVVTPEAGRISLNKFGNAKLEEADLIELCAMLVDQRYDDLFSRKDETGELQDRMRVIQNIVDFIDPDQEALLLNAECGIQSSGGDENRPYDRRDLGIRPRNAFLTHVEELSLIHGVSDEFMQEFGEMLTVYNVGKPDINVAQAPVFYSVLCRNVRMMGGAGGSNALAGYNLCARDPGVAMQVMFMAMALDGIRQFFSDPISVLLAYVGTTESQILPSAKKGQPVAFLSTGQLPQYINDFKTNPLIMAQFLQYSPFYQQMVLMNPQMMVDPIAPIFPPWTVDFDQGGLTRSVSTSSPQIFRVVATGTYGSTESTIEAVVDMNKPMRRIPNEQEITRSESESEDMQQLRELLRQEREMMPPGRILYWREN